MKNQKGITIVSLAVTIIIIMTLASIAIYTGIQSYQNVKVDAFIAKMRIAQEGVNKFCEKYTVPEIISMTDIFSINSASVPEEAKDVLNEVISEFSGINSPDGSWYSEAGDDTATNYRYLSIEQMNTKLGIKDFDTAIFFNPRTKNVIAVNGVYYNGKMYYRQYDLRDGQTLQQPVIDTDFNLSDKLSIKTFDNKAIISISSDVNLAQLRYYKKIGTNYSSEPNYSLNRTELEINESGIYKIEGVTSGGVLKTAEDVEIVIVNKPMLVEGLIPVKYNGSAWIETNKDDQDWYNYSSTEKKWANAIIKDNLNNIVGYYVWIPRYAYHTSKSSDTAGNIDIEFLKGTSSVITTSGDTLANNYKVVPAFQNGSTTGFINGEWNRELTGIWVAKHQSIISNESITTGYAKNVSSSSFATTGKSFVNMSLYCYNIKLQANKLNYDNVDTHLMKNSEWGAVTYLTWSLYGNKSIMRKVSKDTNVIADFSTTTTGNVYGIDEFVGGTDEAVASGLDVKDINKLYYSYLTDSEANSSSKYVTLYNSSLINSNIIGDGVNSTEISWSSANRQTVYPTNTNTYFIRGGYYNDVSTADIFSYNNSASTADVNTGFRPVLIIEY